MQQKPSNTAIKALEEVIFDLHGCKAKWVESVPVKEVFEGETLWEYIVHVFQVNHPETRCCYGWSVELEGSNQRRCFAVLHQGDINSPQKAVKAAIANGVQEAGILKRLEFCKE